MGNNWIISETVDEEMLDVNHIMTGLSNYLFRTDESRLTLEQTKELTNLLEEHPILRILCSAMEDEGAECEIFY